VSPDFPVSAVAFPKLEKYVKACLPQFGSMRLFRSPISGGALYLGMGRGQEVPRRKIFDNVCAGSPHLSLNVQFPYLIAEVSGKTIVPGG
jgi:hypothetical protein